MQEGRSEELVKQIYVARDRIGADLACAALRRLGFGAVVVGDLAAIPSAPYPSVWVPDDEGDAAALAWRDLRGEHDGTI